MVLVMTVTHQQRSRSSLKHVVILLADMDDQVHDAFENLQQCGRDLADCHIKVDTEREKFQQVLQNLKEADAEVAEAKKNYHSAVLKYREALSQYHGTTPAINKPVSSTLLAELPCKYRAAHSTNDAGDMDS